ncbi:TetR/AcrR family transcriptional regulator [uncultured Paludibaculum sp.]|uniref:TetR/AcrR family transcriptional regulator n=1 Tax=uncultured Paludibaculum sp. TaxID=1765020 RepID=UPI002AAA87CF|nr:TetR/AcrR family transcriptional regulator [uncultured Paludibaculum sp.]
MRQPERTKAAILAAAELILIKKGVRGMTLEEVAAAASVSKGGLLHHFSGKEELILGILQHQLNQFEQDVERRRQEDPSGPGAYTRAFLRANLEPDEHASKVCIAFLSESRTIPASLAVAQQHCDAWRKRLENDGIDPILAAIVRYAGDGLMFSALWGMPKATNYDAIVERLLQLTQTAEAQCLQAPSTN